MKLAQVVRDRFNEITEWRSQREPWLEIDGRFRAMGQSPGTNSVRTLYRLELARRSLPEREAALRWASSNYQAIRDLLDQGYDWTAILILIPPNFDVDPGSSGLTRLVAEFKAIERSRTAIVQVDPVPSPPAPFPLNDYFVAVGEAEAVQPPKSTPAMADSSEQVPESLSPKRAVAKRVELTPHFDPFESGPELLKRMDVASKLAGTLNQQARAAPEGERAAIKERESEANRERDQAKVDFLYRFSDYKAIFTKLHIISSSALECGAYVVADAESDDTIMLQGLDRPDRIEGLDAVPEPLIIRENLSEGETKKIQESYAADGLELGERTPVRRLAEALIMRGEYLWRDGWHEYATLVKLVADDFPSPTLSGANEYDLRSKSMDIWPRLTGKEPVQDPEYERKLSTYRVEPELLERGEWK